MKKMRALVVDDSAYNRMAISRMLESNPAVEVVGTATDGADALTKTVRLSPDLITLDLEMPGMDGFTFLRWLMKERPTPVLVISARSGSESVFRALELGAVDFVSKPEARISRSIEDIREELTYKVQAILHLEMANVQPAIELASRGRPEGGKAEPLAAPLEPGPVEIVTIVSSTGGPPAIQAILSSLPPGLSAGIVIAQHMPSGFTRSFAERLNKLSPFRVVEASEGDPIQPGTVLIAPGGSHLRVRRERKGLVSAIVPRVSSDKYVPSGDQMMISAAEACGPGVLGVVLTGMGSDGVEGVTAIKKWNGHVLAESEDSAVIFGMPHEAIRTGSVDKVLPLDKMAEEIASRCKPPQH